MTKILIKRGTYTQWNSSTTPLAIGELGLDTTNDVLKVGNGVDLWIDLPSFVLSSDLSNSLGDYVPIGDVGNPDGVASLDSTGNVPISQLGNIISGAPAVLDTLNELAAALNNDQNFTNTVNTALSGKVSKSGGSTIIPSSGSVAGLSFTPATGQTANLLEFIGGPAGGGVKVGPGGNIFDAPAINANYALTAIAGGSSVVPVTIKGASGQTANLTEWKNNSGNSLVSISSSGVINISPPSAISNQLIDISFPSSHIYPGVLTRSSTSWITALNPTGLDSYWQARFGAYGASTVNIIVKGVASQTANLTEWQNSAGTVLAKITSSGTIQSDSIITDNWIGAGRYYWGNPNTGVQSLSYINGSANAGLTIETINIGSANATFDSVNILTIKGLPNQTGDLQRWVNSSGSVLAKINPSGVITGVGLSLNSTVSGNMFSVDPIYGNITSRGGAVGFSGAASLNIGTMYSGGSAIVASGQPSQSVPTIIVKAVTSQTSNLIEWQNSSGTAIAKVDVNGGAQFLGLNVQGTGSGIVNIGTAAAGYVGLIIKGVSSQTADLQQWQDSNGNILTRIDSNGMLGINTSVLSGTLSSRGTLSIIPTTSGDTAITIKAASGQGVNLFEVQNSSSSVITRISSTGGFLTNGQLQVNNIYGGGSASAFIWAGSASMVPIKIVGAASQTANLQEWQNSSNTVLASIDSSGSMFTTTASAGTNTTQVATTAFVKTAVDNSNLNIYITDSGTARTLSSNDTYKIIEMTSSSSITITIPNDASDSTFPIGSWIEVRQMGTGQITVTATSPATVVATDSQFKTRVRYSSVVLEKRASNAWYLAGDTTA